MPPPQGTIPLNPYQWANPIFIKDSNYCFNSLAIRLHIVFIWSQHDGGNVEQRQWLKFPPKLMMPKLNDSGRRLFI